MNPAMSPSLEDYLKTIGRLAEKGNVRVTDIALHLGVSKPSVFTALKTLSAKGLVNHERYRLVSLTREGKRQFDEIWIRYTAALAFLQRTLGVSTEIAEKDACKLEHILSDETLKKLRALEQITGNTYNISPAHPSITARS
jgi:DtxR family Mn-dependent transcriptional regulator